MPAKKLVFLVAILLTSLFSRPSLAYASLPADLEPDGDVDILDFNIFLVNFGKTGAPGWIRSDIKSDGAVNLLDFNLLIASFGQTESVSTPTPTPPPQTQGSGIWISKEEIMRLPTSGAAWDRLRSAAYGSWGTPDLKNQDNKYGLNVLAGALVYARTGDATLRSKTRDGIMSAKKTMDDASEWQTTNGVLSLGRQLGAFVISADLIDFKNFDSPAENEFRNWLQVIRKTNVGTHGRWKSITYTCENSANNWGTFACPSRLAVSIYLGDTADVTRTANIIRAFMGERQYYPSDAPGKNGYFEHTNAADWPCNESTWTAVNPSCIKSGINLDGALVEDAARGGNCCTLQGSGIGYSWEVLQGVFVSTEFLYRTGKFGNPYSWSNQALKRAMDFMQRSGWNITGPAPYVPWMANKRYGTSYPTTSTGSGRIMSWTDWTHP